MQKVHTKYTTFGKYPGGDGWDRPENPDKTTVYPPEGDVSPDSYFSRKEQQKSWEELLKHPWDWLLTINTNSPRCAEERGWSALENDFDLWVNRHFLGARWHDSRVRVPWAAVRELGADRDLHYHVLLEEPPHPKVNWRKWPNMEHGFAELVACALRRRLPACDVDAKSLVGDEGDAVNYVVKNLWQPSAVLGSIAFSKGFAFVGHTGYSV